MSDHIRTSRRSLLAVAALAAPSSWLATGVSRPAFAGVRAGGPAAGASTALAWHDLTAQVVAAAAFPEPVTQSRTWAVSWLAAARATRPDLSLAHGTAAFAQALHDTLVALVPSQKDVLDSALTATVAGIPDGPQRSRGIADGAAEARRTLAERADDGLDTAAVDVAWEPDAAAPGVFQLTPPTSRVAVRAGQGAARAFLLRSNDQFDPGAPYSLDSSAYARDLAEVKELGASAGPRTAEQSQVASFWYPGLTFAHVQITRALLASSQRRSFAALSRLVAAFHVISTDAQIAIYNAKYSYRFWRPYTAITTGTMDPDPSWTSFQVAPQHPEYPSGHGGQIGAQQGVLDALVGTTSPVPITLTSPSAPGVTRTSHDWSTITQDVVDARVWEGVHFRTSDVVGVELGLRVARWELGQLHRLGI